MGGEQGREKSARASQKPEHRYLEINQWQFGADSSIIFKFILLCVEARGDGPFSLQPAFNSSLVDSNYDCKIRQNATLTGQERQGDVQMILALFCYILTFGLF